MTPAAHARIAANISRARAALAASRAMLEACSASPSPWRVVVMPVRL